MAGRIKIAKIAKAVRKPTIKFSLGLGILFIAVAGLQDWFVHKQVYAKTAAELNSWAQKISKAIAFENGWDLRGYRNASVDVPNWYVVTSNGLVIDIEGFTPGLLPPVHPPQEISFETPQTTVSEIGEKWRLFGKKVKGGVVILGIDDFVAPDELSYSDRRLVANAAKFGSTLEEALLLNTRELDFIVDFAVIADSGELRSAWGGIPLRTDPGFLTRLPRPGKPTIIASKSYLVANKPILDSSNRVAGAVIIPKDITLEQQTIREHLLFNLGLGAASFIFAVLAAAIVIGREVAKKPRHMSLDEARASGEGQHFEFKRALEWDFGRAQQNTYVQLAILKTIAAFLNSAGGTLFIGVRDDGSICGIKEDLGLFNGSRDKFRLHLRDLVTERIGSEFAHLVNDRIDEIEGQAVCVVDVEGAPSPAWVKWDQSYRYFVREGPKTSDLNPKEAMAHVQNRARRNK